MISPLGFTRPEQSAVRRAAVRVFALAIVLLFGLAMAAPLFAHSWYPWECCSDRDCAPVPAGKVKEVFGGWLLEDGTFIAYAEARVSPDKDFHVCRRQDGKGPLIRLDKKPACFWAPIGAS